MKISRVKDLLQSTPEPLYLSPNYHRLVVRYESQLKNFLAMIQLINIITLLRRVWDDF